MRPQIRSDLSSSPSYQRRCEGGMEFPSLKGVGWGGGGSTGRERENAGSDSERAATITAPTKDKFISRVLQIGPFCARQPFCPARIRNSEESNNKRVSV
ncbi:hypothetical protein CEXT_441051 [Caerostris extrusa]|uniref:Uncharacterized protein n=1 Tax=Caerostris extrusa TaxID=172846 RepID=A0AAV4NF12_CAEEX|nr:hypothetical protein CEXT_441051 [Caerostris extrusa]